MLWLTTLPSKYTLALATAVTFLNSVGADMRASFRVAQVKSIALLCLCCSSLLTVLWLIWEFHCRARPFGGMRSPRSLMPDANHVPPALHVLGNETSVACL